MAAKMKTEKSKSNSLSSKAIEFLRSVDAGKVNKNPIKAKNDIIDEIKDEAKGNTYADTNLTSLLSKLIAVMVWLRCFTMN